MAADDEHGFAPRIEADPARGSLPEISRLAAKTDAVPFGPSRSGSNVDESRSRHGQEMPYRGSEPSADVGSLLRIEERLDIMTDMLKGMQEEMHRGYFEDSTRNSRLSQFSRNSRSSARLTPSTFQMNGDHHEEGAAAKASKRASLLSMLADVDEEDSQVKMHDSMSRLRCEGTRSSLTRSAPNGFVAPTLPLHWPSVIQKKGDGARRVAGVDWMRHGLESIAIAAWESNAEHATSHKMRCSLIQDPNSVLNVALEFIGVFILAYDLVAVPYILAWDVEVEGALQVLSMTSLLFWTLDVLISMVRAYYRDGELITSPGAVVVRYLRTWFVPDVSIVVSEWVSLGLLQMEEAQDKDSGSLKILRLAKLGKLLRLLSALRIFRLARLVESFVQRSISESVRMTVQIGALSFAFLWLNHMVTCAWYGIGRVFPSGTGMRWIEMTWETGNDVYAFSEVSTVYQYLTAFHWAMAQTTLGAMEVTPTNSWERLFNVVCLMFGLLFGSTLVSSLSATMVEVQVRNRDRFQKLSTLRRYLNENNINRFLALKAQRQVADRLSARTVLLAKDVTALDILSSSLQQDLHTEICKQHISKHAMLRTWALMDPAWFRKLCVTAVSIVSTRVGDEIFAAGSDALATYYIITGSVKYVQEPETSPVRCIETTTVGDKTRWLCECALWSHWTHVGTAEVTVNCQIASIDPGKFWESQKNHVVISAIAREYCNCFHQRIVTAKPPEAAWPNDLRVPYTDQGDIVYSMSPEVQQQIGLTALSVLQPGSGVSNLVSGGTSTAVRSKLLQEVMDCKSVVILNAKGRPERVVSLIIMSLLRDDGDVLYQVGSIARDGQRKARSQLPGVKRTRDESTSDALARLADSKLAPIKDLLTIKSVETVIEEKESKDYGVHTTYIRKICHAELSEGAGEFESDPDLGVVVTPSSKPTAEEARRSGRISIHAANAAVSFGTNHRKTLGSNIEQPPLLLDLFQRKVYFSSQTGLEGEFYMWLSESLVDWLNTSIGENSLSQLVQSLEVPMNSSLTQSHTPVVPVDSWADQETRSV